MLTAYTEVYVLQSCQTKSLKAESIMSPHEKNQQDFPNKFWWLRREKINFHENFTTEREQRGKNRKFIDFPTLFLLCVLTTAYIFAHIDPRSLSQVRNDARHMYVQERAHKTKYNSNFSSLTTQVRLWHECQTNRLWISLSFHRHGDPKWVNKKFQRKFEKYTG